MKAAKSGRIGWNGSKEKSTDKSMRVGVFDTDIKSGPGMIEMKFAAPGWGFGNAWGGDNEQSYGWEGKKIARTTFEIAVSASELTPDEQKHLLH